MLHRKQSLGAPTLWAYWAQVKYPLKDLLPKEPENYGVGLRSEPGSWIAAEIMAQNWTIAVGS